MPKIVEVPGLGEVEFPDQMDNAAIAASIRKTLASRTTQKLEQMYPQHFGANAQQQAPGVDVSVGGFARGVANTVTGLYEAGKRVLAGPQSPRDWVAFAAAGPLGPIVGDLLEGQVATGQKAIEAGKQGRYSEAAGYATAAALPVVGPATAALGEKLGEGKVSEAAGEIVGGAVIPKVLSKVKSAPVVPQVLKPALSAEDAAAVSFGQNRNVRLDAATRTGSKVAANLQKHVQESIGGSNHAREFRAGQVADLERVGSELANEVSPRPMSPETAAGEVRRGITDRISDRGLEANRQYKTVREIEADPANVEVVQNGLDEAGKPRYEEIALPVDHRDMKQALKPIELEYQRVLTPAEQRANPTLHAIRQILNGPDFLPASKAELNLGALKQFRSAGDGGAANVAEGLAAKVIREYDQAIRAKVQGARRSGSAAPAAEAPATAPAVETPAPSSAAPAAAVNPNLSGVVGNGETQIRVPGQPGYKARYEVRELEGVQPSHDPQTFQRNRNYALTNDRDYARSPADQAKVVNHAKDFKPAEIINDAPNALTGPPVIDAQGNALGGNGRTMTIGRVYRGNGEGAAAYRATLEGKAAQFGIDPAQVKGMKQPVLVRVVDDADLPDVAARQKAITDFNIKDTAELRPSERAIADARRVSQSTLDDIGGRMANLGEDATLAKALEGQAGGPLIDALIKDGVIAAGERGALVEGHVLTKAGRDRVSALLVGRFFKDSAQLDNVAPSVRAKLERIAAPLAKTEGGNWALTGHVQDAVDLLESARAAGTPLLDDFLRQGGLFGEGRYSPQAIQLARQLQGQGSRKLEAAARQYAADAEFARGGESLFGDAITPEESFAQAFGGSIDEAPKAAAAPGAAPAAAPPTRMKFETRDAGGEAMAALKAGRLATYEKWRADKILKKLGDEPVTAFKKLVSDQDRSINHLRRVVKEAPEKVQDVARAFVDGMLEELKKGDYANGKTVETSWLKMGKATKEILFPNPIHRQNISDYVRLVRKASENPNPSGTAAVRGMQQQVLTTAGGIGMLVAVPSAGAATLALQGVYVLSNAAISRMLFSPRGAQALTRGLRVPLGNKAAAAAAAAEILKLAKEGAKPLPLAAQGSPSQSTEERAAIAKP